MAYERENILIVDDDIHILELLQRHLHSLNYHTFRAISVEQASQILKESEIDLLITDIQMPEVDGLQLLKYTAEHYPQLPKLVITGFPSVEGALDVIKSGATAYLTKPFTKEELKQAVQKSFGNHQNQPPRSEPRQLDGGSGAGMIGSSEAFIKILDTVGRLKDNRATVLIQGESGTGKELVARAIHYSGKYSRAPFIAVNCAAIPQELLEAELFGYTKGAFTGAAENRDGFFQAANGGTLFLDEIGNASLAVQAKLLRALQEKEIFRVGSRKSEKVELRIIAATNSDLLDNVSKHTFREDLYYRLSVVGIRVPSLRERKSDIPDLVALFLRKYGLEYRDRYIKIDPEALEVLDRYDWPGNIRELESVIQRAVIMCNEKVTLNDLPENLKYKINFPEKPFVSLKELEKDYILKVLAYTGNNKTKAAAILQIDRKTLREKLKN